MDDAKKWSSSSNEAVHLTLKHPTDPKKNAEFGPAFTYPIFGTEETVFGYEKLRIHINFQADTLQPGVEIGWREQFESVGETKADDVEEPLKPLLPTVYDEAHSAPQPGEASAQFTPPGELVHQYEVDGRSFGIWTTLLTDSKAKRILRHMQILIPLFIEGGTCIELDDPDWTIERWRVFFLYEIDTPLATPDKPVYLFAGYSTTYRLFFLDAAHPDYYTLKAAPNPKTKAIPNHTPSSQPLPPPIARLGSTLPSRQRISQFLILPPYQRTSHGHTLYTTLLTHLLSYPTTAEITVEDPNESFDALRDTSDLHRLRTTQATFSSLRLNTAKPFGPAPPKTKPIPFDALLPTTLIKTLRKDTKLAPRQFGRLLEMQLLSTIPPRHRSTSRITRKSQSSDASDRAYYFWRLLVKERLFRHNRDMLMQVEGEERIERIEETVAGVEREYEGVVERVGRWAAREAEAVVHGQETAQVGEERTNGEKSASAGAEMRKTKRKIVEEDDEDDGDGEEGKGISTAEREDTSGKRSTSTLASRPAKKGVKTGADGETETEVVDLEES